jgi:hypothetical protein
MTGDKRVRPSDNILGGFRDFRDRAIPFLWDYNGKLSQEDF